jgi:hypothetical protein
MDAPKNDRGGAEVLGVAESWKNVAEVGPLFCYASDVILYLAVLPALLAATELLACPPPAWAAAVLLLPVYFAFSFFRLRAKKRIFFAAGVFLTFLASAAAFLLLGGWPAAVCCAGGAAVSVSRFQRMLDLREAALERLSSPVKMSLGMGTAVFSFLVSAASYLWAYAAGSRWLMLASTAAFVTVCVLMFVYSHAYGRHCFSVWEKMSGTEEKNQQKFGSGFFALFAALGFSALAALAAFTAQLTGASRIDDAFLNFLYNGFGVTVPKNSTDTSASQTEGISEELKQELEKSAGHSPFLDALGAVLKIVFFAVAAAACVLLLTAGIRALVLWIRGLSGSTGEDRRSVFLDVKPLAEARRKFRRNLSDLALFARGSNNIRIRRLFLAFVRRRKNSAVILGSDAPGDIVRKAGADTAEPEEAAALYERARYAKGECSAGDVSRMQKSLARKKGETKS